MLLHRPDPHPLLEHAALTRHGQLVPWLIEKTGADPNARRFPYYKTALHEAACTTLSIVKLLVAHGVNINAGHTFDNITALTIAKRCGKSDIVTYLEANGARTDAESAWKKEALPLAIAAAEGPPRPH